MRWSALKANDGARFRGGVKKVALGCYRAHCYAQLDSGSHIEEEMPSYQMCESEAAGRSWIECIAIRRGFDRYVLER